MYQIFVNNIDQNIEHMPDVQSSIWQLEEDAIKQVEFLRARGTYNCWYEKI